MRPTDTFVGQPIRSLQTMLRVLHLDDDRYPRVIPDGIYGNDTQQAVAAFQRQHGIPVTGVADQPTWDAIVDAYEQAIIRVDKAESIEILLDAGEILRFGTKDPHIYLLQSMLTYLSEVYPTISRPTHSGYLDAQTATSVESFQRLNGLPITGNVDRKTWKYISRLFTLAVHKQTKNKR